jgi:hypothetical protein
MLTRIRARAIANLERQPNYTCTETVERTHRIKPSQKFQSVDTIRLEVALVNGREMFGWPGAKKFEDTDLRAFVAEGAIGNGSFAAHARAVFGGEATRLDYIGVGSTGNQPWVRFAYQVPIGRSSYALRVGKQKAIVAYHGSFDADPKSFDLERMEVVADQIPADLGLARVSDRVEYARKQIGSGEFLLPAGSQLILVNLDGSEERNQVRFASCRHFAGESVVTFDDPPTSSPAVAADVEELVLPPDLDVTLALLDDIDLSNAAVGDPVRAQLRNNLKVKGRLLLPKNAIATGHITRVERHSQSLMLGLIFDELEAPGVRAQLRLRLDDVASTDRVLPRERYLQSALRPGEGILPLAVGRVHLNRGLLMNWSTAP